MKRYTRKFLRGFNSVKDEFISKPVHVLEIGVFLGHTADWLLDNVLTHEDARYVGIDPWEWFETMKRRFPTYDDFKKVLDTIEGLREKHAGKAQFIKGFSQDILRSQEWKKQSFDLVHIDGHHTIHSVLRDWVYTWPLLKINGIMIFDDYKQKRSDRVIVACNAIIKALGNSSRRFGSRASKIDILWESKSLGIRKLSE